MYCVKKVEDTLKKVKGLKRVEVSLEEKKATVTMKQEVADEELKNVVKDLGYHVVEIVYI